METFGSESESLVLSSPTRGLVTSSGLSPVHEPLDGSDGLQVSGRRCGQRCLAVAPPGVGAPLELEGHRFHHWF